MNDITFTPYVRNENTVSPNPEYRSIFSDYISSLDDNESEKAEDIEIPAIVPEEKPVATSTTTLKTPLTFNWKDNSLVGKSRNSREYLMKSLNLTDFQASALAGVFRAESGLNPGAENDFEKSGQSSNVKANQYGIGINQWTRGRHDNYVNWIAQHGSGLQSELDFTTDEIKTKYPEFLAALRSAKTLEEAVGYVYTMYTGANYRNVNSSNLKAMIQKVELPYINNARKNGWSTAGVGFNKRLREATAVLQCKLGGVLKLQVGGPLGTFQEKEIPQTLFDPSFKRPVRKAPPIDTDKLPYSDSEMAARQYWAESRFKNDSTSEKGAMGAYQIMPATWDEVTSKNNITGDPYDYGTNAVVRDIIIDNLSKYPAFQGYKDPTKKALVYAAYNWGQGNVSNLLQERKAKGEDPDKLDWINGLPKQTQDYVNFVVFGKDGSNDLTNEKLLEAINNFKQ
jgi:hypothetical protein